jgi:hypothetical protein
VSTHWLHQIIIQFHNTENIIGSQAYTSTSPGNLFSDMYIQNLTEINEISTNHASMKLTYCMKMAVFWVAVLCSLVEVHQRFRGPCCLHHQGDETLVNFYQTTRCCNQEDSHLHTRHCENLKPCDLLYSSSPLVTQMGSTSSQSGVVLFVHSSISFSACSFQLAVFNFNLNTCPHNCNNNSNHYPDSVLVCSHIWL